MQRGSFLSDQIQESFGLSSMATTGSSMGFFSVTNSVNFNFALTQQLQIENAKKPVLNFHNAVCTVFTNTTIDLAALVKIAPNIKYEPKRFGGAIMKISDPKTTALIFASGKIVVTGAKTPLHAKQASKKFVRILQRIFPNKRFQSNDFKTHNVVAKADVKFPLNLEQLSFEENCFSYEPELFQGVVYRPNENNDGNNVCMLIFLSGKIVITGGKSEKEIKDAFDTVFPILKKYRKFVIKR